MLVNQKGDIEYRNIFVNYARRAPDQNNEWPIRYFVFFPIFHPAVSSRGEIAGKTVEDCIKSFCDLDYACREPYNIDAAVMYKRNYDKFVQKNKDIFKALKNDCPICFLKMESQDVYTCVRGHVYHITCTDDTGTCPVYECCQKILIKI